MSFLTRSNTDRLPELREFRALHSSRFDATTERRLSELDSTVERRIAQLESRMIERLARIEELFLLGLVSVVMFLMFLTVLLDGGRSFR
jgi:hypothetical protein